LEGSNQVVAFRKIGTSLADAASAVLVGLGGCCRRYDSDGGAHGLQEAPPTRGRLGACVGPDGAQQQQQLQEEIPGRDES
jgi:hypothetical protein